MTLRQGSYFCIVLLYMLALTPELLPAKMRHNYVFPLVDSLIAPPDTIKASFWTDYQKNQHIPAKVSLSLNSLFAGTSFPWLNLEYKGIGSDWIDVSRELVDTYYSNRILLYRFREHGFVYLSLKDAQNSQGLLQIRIPFGNFRKFHDRWIRKL